MTGSRKRPISQINKHNTDSATATMTFTTPPPTSSTAVDNYKLNEAPYKKHKHALLKIAEPHENDVLFGRGGKAYHHVGNKAFRSMVLDYKPNYEHTAKRTDKAVIALAIVNRLRYDQSPPGRFLSFDAKSRTWYDVGDKKARGKTSQALREKPTVAVANSTTSSSQSEQDVPPKLAEEESLKKTVHKEAPRKKRRLDMTDQQEQEVQETQAQEPAELLLDAYEPVPLEALETPLPEFVTCDSSDMDVVSLMASEGDVEDDFSLGEETYFPPDGELAWEGDLGLATDDFIFSGLKEIQSESEDRNDHAAVSFDGAEDVDTCLFFLDDVRDAFSLPYATMSLSTIDFDNIFDDQRVAQELEQRKMNTRKETQGPGKTSNVLQVTPPPALNPTVSLDMDSFDLDEGVFQLFG